MVAFSQAKPALTIAVGPLASVTAREPFCPDGEPFVVGADGAVDAIATTFARPVFEHTVSWAEIGKDPNRYGAQFFIGNGNFCDTGITFSAPPMKERNREGYANVYDQIEYAATFKAGVSVFRTTDVEGGRTVANSCCPHLPYLTYHRVREPGQPVYHNALDAQASFEIVNLNDAAAVRNAVEEGTVTYTLVLRDRHSGHTLTQRAEKLASLADPMLAVSRLELTTDFEGDLVITSGFDGTLINNLAEGYNKFQQVHTEASPDRVQAFAPTLVGLALQTVKEQEENLQKLEKSEWADNPTSTTPTEVRNQTQYHFGFAKRLRYFVAEGTAEPIEIQPELLADDKAGTPVGDAEREIYVNALVHLKPGQRLIIEDRTALSSSIDRGLRDQRPLEAARAKAASDERFAAAKAAHVAAWRTQFSNGRIALFGGPRAMEFQAPIDLCRSALLKTVSDHNRDIAADMGAKGLHDGRYRTHNFWEMAILFWKVKAIQSPEAAKGLAELYIKNLDSARAYARSMGRRKGAQFGWQTTADGKPDTQVVKWNGVAQQWDPDFSKYQPHNNWAFFYGIDQIYRVGGDRVFLAHAMPLLIELVRFGADSCVKQADGKYHTVGMMDPNEYNEKLPGSTLPNLPDSFYNNFMIAKMASRVFELLDELEAENRTQVLRELGVDAAEIAQIKELATNMFFPITSAAKKASLVDLSGSVKGEVDVPAGTIENYAGFTDMPLVHWPSMREWLTEENVQRVAQGKKEIKPHFTPAGVIPRADQVLKAVELRAKLAGIIADVQVRAGRWLKAADPSDAQITLVKDARSGQVVWKLDSESDRVFPGTTTSADVRAFAQGKHAEGKQGSVKPVLNTPDNFQIGKQAGSLQTVANFAAGEVVQLLKDNGYAVDLGTIARNVEYYDKLVNTNGSSLANVGTGVGKIGLGELKASVENYDAVVHLDAKDLEAGTARQGFRAGNMAASELMPLIYLGIDLKASNQYLAFDPRLPADIGGIELFAAAYGQRRIFARADGLAGKLTLRANGLSAGEQLTVMVCGRPGVLTAGDSVTFDIPRARD
ncbi:MAG: glycoside hydrolase family 65 protein [Polyangiaceae bacterium]|nr:glycoside hydrolase family 65 protein [Polyangiaceae bacterium]